MIEFASPTVILPAFLQWTSRPPSAHFVGSKQKPFLINHPAEAFPGEIKKRKVHKHTNIKRSTMNFEQVKKEI